MFGTGFRFGKVGLNGPRPGKYRHIGLPLAPGTSLGAAQGGGHPGSAVMGRRPAARGLPWVRVVSVWDVMVSVGGLSEGRSKRLVSVLRSTLAAKLTE